ncbi:MAG: hypothetical protein J7502_13380, partial [Flavisolibacter sp.]|nr:hypothetical protein [Flavisolibacter sp.]
MPLPFSHHPSSYRDPSGFLFYRDGILYRQVNKIFAPDFEMFMQNGLHDHLLKKQLLISDEIINKNLTGSDNWHLTLQPEFIPFISY